MGVTAMANPFCPASINFLRSSRRNPLFRRRLPSSLFREEACFEPRFGSIMIELLPLRARVSSAFADKRMQRAFQIFRDRESEIEAEQVRLTMIPAPPFEERERASHVAEVFRTMGLNPSVDSLGNVLAWYSAAGPN